MRILLLGGSPTAPSTTNRLLQHIGDKLALHGHRTIKLQVRDLPPRPLLHGDTDDSAIRRALFAVADAQAIVIGTPVYKAAYTGLLKAFLDLLPQNGLAGKLVLPVATGGSQSHMLALDYALRPVLQSSGARHVLTSIFATAQQLSWKDGAGLTLDPSIAFRVAAGVEELNTALRALAADDGETPAAAPVPHLPQLVRLAQ